MISEDFKFCDVLVKYFTFGMFYHGYELKYLFISQVITFHDARTTFLYFLKKYVSVSKP